MSTPPILVNRYQRWEELGDHNKDFIDQKGVVNAATPIIQTTGSRILLNRGGPRDVVRQPRSPN